MADYIPITDQEIEPEAPITSILQHKLRDNLIAIAEGSPGAPIFRVFADGLSIATWERSFATDFSGDITQGGGIFGKTFEYASSEGDIGSWASFKDCYRVNSFSRARSINIAISFNWSQSPPPAILFVNYNAPQTVQDYSWVFILKNMDTGKVESLTFQDHHISFGMRLLIDHPFVSEDLTGKQVFLVNLTKQQTDELKIKTIPTIGGGYFDNLSQYDEQLVDHTRISKSVLEVFGENYVLDFSELDWINDVNFTTLCPYNSGNLPFIKIPKPESVTRIGVLPV